MKHYDQREGVYGVVGTKRREYDTTPLWHW